MTLQNVSIPYHLQSISCVLSTPPLTPANTPVSSKLIFTHGAGGTLASSAIANFSNGFSRQLPVLCFKGNSNLGSRTKMFSAVISSQEAPTSLGGRSMGARAAVMAATDQTEHLVLISYPLHTGSQVRDQVLYDISPMVKVIFVSGDGDSMCNLPKLDEVRSRMRCQTWRVVVEGADHGMDVKPKKLTEAVGIMTGEVVAGWIKGNDDSRREGRIFCDDDGEVKWTGWERAEKETAASTKAKQESTMPENTTSNYTITPNGKGTVMSATNSESTPKRSRSNVGHVENKSASKRTRKPTDAVHKKDPKQDNVSGRTRAAKRAQHT
ncbi:MAG: hypothetical protein LQ337_008047 [Flavoplaca oasis]|nr:MAG: hypothetical protein LQ337_008047 [Flavoplaca oasis]